MMAHMIMRLDATAIDGRGDWKDDVDGRYAPTLRRLRARR